MQQLDSVGSTVLVMVETREYLENIDSIAAIESVGVLLLGAHDLLMELGILGEWEHPIFRKALEDIAAVAERAGRILALWNCIRDRIFVNMQFSSSGLNMSLHTLISVCLQWPSTKVSRSLEVLSTVHELEEVATNYLGFIALCMRTLVSLKGFRFKVQR